MNPAVSDGSLSLYFQLKEGEKADLEVIAQAAIDWVATLRAAALEIDPNAKIKVEFIDANEGSLRLNTILEWLEDQISRIDIGSSRYPRLRKIALAMAIFIPVSGVPTYDFYFGDDTELELSQEDRDRIDTLIKAMNNNPEVKEKTQEFYKTLEKDSAIKGVGVTEQSDKVPSIIIPSSEFPARSGVWQIMLDDKQDTRTIYPVLNVTLISPVLIKKTRSWKFQAEGLPEFSAKMADQKFLSALEDDHLRERLRIGIPMTIRLKVIEENSGGVWVAKSRTVVEVISPNVD